MIITEQQAYTNLANAIIEKACHDYRMALLGNCEERQKEIEKFFLSEYFMTLTNVDGKTLMRKIREMECKK